MQKNKPLQSPKMICRLLSIGLFLFCAGLYATPTKADIEQTDYSAYQNQCDSAACAYEQLIGTGIAGSSTQLTVYADSNNNASLKMRIVECSDETLTSCSTLTNDYDSSSDIDLGTIAAVANFYTAPAEYSFYADKYYQILLNYQGGQLNIYGNPNDDYQYGFYYDTWTMTPSASVEDMYFSLNGPTRADAAATTSPITLNQELFSSPINTSLGIWYTYNNTVATSTDTISLYACPISESYIGCDTSEYLGEYSIYNLLDAPYTGHFVVYATSTGWQGFYFAYQGVGTTTFIVQWTGPQDLSDIPAWIASSTQASYIDGISAHDRACTPEEWAATSTFLGLNGTVIRCSIFEGLLKIGDSIAAIPKKIIASAGQALSVIFPFNIPIQIKNSFDASATAELPTDLTFLDLPDANGNVWIDMPDWAENGTTTPVLVFGPDVFQSGAADTLFYLRIRKLTDYAIPLIFLTGCFLLGTKIKEDIEYFGVVNHHKEIEDETNAKNWQL